MSSEPAGRDYSQYGEQEAILRHTPQAGRFLEVGSWDAFDLSNVRALYENGWSGVLVEPHPGHAARLRHTYRYSTAVDVLERAVVIEGVGATIALHLSDDAVSTADERTRQKWEAEARYALEPLEVATVTIAALWREHGPFQFVSLDAEGFSVPILEELLEHCRPLPACVCVEFDHLERRARRAAWNYGYRSVLANDTNLVLAK